jgi:hypothetical protein
MNRRTFTQVLAATALGAATATQSKALGSSEGLPSPTPSPTPYPLRSDWRRLPMRGTATLNW